MGVTLSPIQWSVRTLVALFSITLVFIFTASALLVYLNEREVIWVQTTRIGTDKRLMARAGAQRMESFFERVEMDLRILSQVGVREEVGQAQARRLMEEAVDRYAGTPLVSMVRTDKDGRLLFSVNRERLPIALGMDLSDREYFRWARTQADDEVVFLSEALVARADPLEGHRVVVVAVPVFVDDRFDGVMFASVGFRMLIEDYVASLAVYEGSDVSVVDSNGTVIFGLLGRDISGRHLNELIRGKRPSELGQYERYVEDILSGVNSWAEMELSVGGEQGREKWIVGFAPIEFGGQMWSLLAMVSHEEALGRIERYQRVAQGGLLFAGMVTVVLGGLLILTLRKTQFVWFKRGVELAKKAKRVVGIE